MKKILIFGILLICTSIFAKEEVVINTNYEMPAFNGEVALTIDATSLGGKFSALQLTNYSKYKDLNFDVFVHSPLTNKWESLGTATLPGFGAESLLGKKFPNLGLYRYFVLVAKSTKEDWQFNTKVNHGKLGIEVFTNGADMTAKPMPYHKASGAYVITKKQLPSDADENIRLINMTSSQTISVAIFGWNKKEYKWVKIGGITATSGQKKAPSIEVEDKKLAFTNFDYLAIVPGDGLQHDYRFNDDHDDWNIIIEDHVSEE